MAVDGDARGADAIDELQVHRTACQGAFLGQVLPLQAHDEVLVEQGNFKAFGEGLEVAAVGIVGIVGVSGIARVVGVAGIVGVSGVARVARIVGVARVVRIAGVVRITGVVRIAGVVGVAGLLNVPARTID